jgi:putative ABC transport system ATP-binding protein
MIKLQNLVKSYLTEDMETTALNGLDLEVKNGDFLSIMGPSGCGKTTLLNIIGMLDSPSSGNYFFDEEEISSYSEKQLATLRKNSIGFIFQSFNLIDDLTVFENVELPLIYLKTPKSERKERVTAILEKLQIAHRAKHFPRQLSGGQQQRVAVSRALVSGQQLILADEPTGNLDSVTGEETMNLMKSLNDEGTTVIMVTHSLKDAQYGKRIVNLLDGKIHTLEVRDQNHA